MYLEHTTNGIAYEWSLTGPDGAHFTLYPNKELHTPEDLDCAKSELRRERDVVSMRHEWKSKQWFDDLWTKR